MIKNIKHKQNKNLGQIFDKIQNYLHSSGNQQTINTFNNNTFYLKFKKNEHKNCIKNEFEIELHLNKKRSKFNSYHQEIESTELQTKFQNWDYKDVVEWIMKIENGLFLRYKNILLSTMKEQEITGDIIGDITMNDLDRMGIKSFKHKNILINNLKQFNVNNIDINENNEKLQNWDYVDIVSWIIELENGIFLKYKDILLQQFAQENVSGNTLSVHLFNSLLF